MQPDAKLGGVLRVLFWIAVAIVSVAVLLAGGILVERGVMGSLLAWQDMYATALRGDSPTALALRAALFPFSALLVWALCVVILTLRRSRLGPPIICFTFAIWILAKSIVPTMIYFVGSESLFPILPILLGDVIVILGFCGYMIEGKHPRNVYNK